MADVFKVNVCPHIYGLRVLATKYVMDLLWLVMSRYTDNRYPDRPIPDDTVPT